MEERREISAALIVAAAAREADEGRRAGDIGVDVSDGVGPEPPPDLDAGPDPVPEAIVVVCDCEGGDEFEQDGGRELMSGGMVVVKTRNINRLAEGTSYGTVGKEPCHAIPIWKEPVPPHVTPRFASRDPHPLARAPQWVWTLDETTARCG